MEINPKFDEVNFSDRAFFWGETSSYKDLMWAIKFNLTASMGITQSSKSHFSLWRFKQS